MKNYFKLNFDKTVTRLAGYPYGESVFKEQIAGRVDYSDLPIKIEFPDNIIRSGSSFTQGFFKVFISKFGYNCIGNEVQIITKNQSLINSIKDNLI